MILTTKMQVCVVGNDEDKDEERLLVPNVPVGRVQEPIEKLAARTIIMKKLFIKQMGCKKVMYESVSGLDIQQRVNAQGKSRIDYSKYFISDDILSQNVYQLLQK